METYSVPRSPEMTDRACGTCLSSSLPLAGTPMGALAGLPIPLAFVLAVGSASADCSMRPTSFTCEYLTDPLGSDVL